MSYVQSVSIYATFWATHKEYSSLKRNDDGSLTCELSKSNCFVVNVLTVQPAKQPQHSLLILTNYNALLYNHETIGRNRDAHYPYEFFILRVDSTIKTVKIKMYWFTQWRVTLSTKDTNLLKITQHNTTSSRRSHVSGRS